MWDKTVLVHGLFSPPSPSLQIHTINCICIQNTNYFTYRSSQDGISKLFASNILLVWLLCLTLYDFGCLCFHCTRTNWATTRVTMRMSTISACMASWPLCLACILACSTLWKKKNILNWCYVARSSTSCCLITMQNRHALAVQLGTLASPNGNDWTVRNVNFNTEESWNVFVHWYWLLWFDWDDLW